MCAEMIVQTARICPHCRTPFDDAGLPIAAPPAGSAPQSDATGGIIPYKNAPALIAYYCGVFSIIPCFPIGFVGLVLGIIGLRKARRMPEVKGKVHAWIGILVGGFFGLFWLAMTILGFVASAMR
jgi:hypothetical protein